MIEEIASMFGLDVFGFSILLIIIAVIIIVISIIVNVIVTRTSKEESVALKVLKDVKKIEKGKLVPKKEKSDEKNNKIEKVLESKRTDISMKEHLSKKFKPKIEKQLKTKVELLDFSGKGNEFHALIEVSGVKVMLILDSSGKIIDYKKK